MLGTLGHTPAAIGLLLRTGWVELWERIPRRGVFWGLASMFGAFVLLAIGAALSLRTGGRRVKE